jgi:hypothetical protein
MDALQFYREEVDRQAYTAAVYRADGTSSYESTSMQQVGQIAVSISDATSVSETVTEGSDEDTSLRGLTTPTYDANGNLTETVAVNDELRLTNAPRRYTVTTKNGIPNDIDPEVWELGLERANVDE